MARNSTIFQSDNEIRSIISAGVDFDGSMSFTAPVLIQGRVKGSIQTESDVFISSTAILNADVNAQRMSVKGTINGNVCASERMELFRSARLSGSIKSPDLVMQSGALVNAMLSMTAITVSDILEESEGEL